MQSPATDFGHVADTLLSEKMHSNRDLLVAIPTQELRNHRTALIRLT